MIVYISGKITGNENYKADFERGENWIAKKGHIVISPAKLDGILPNATHQQYMTICYKLIDMCDCVAMLDGWQESKGAKAELTYAKSLGKKVIYEKYYTRKRNNEERISD